MSGGWAVQNARVNGIWAGGEKGVAVLGTSLKVWGREWKGVWRLGKGMASV